MIIAHGEIPEEAWQDVPPPYQPPGEIPPLYEPPFPGGVPLIPPIGVPPFLPLAESGYGVGLFNLTRPGSADYYVGDQWRILALGPPFGQTEVHAWHNGVDAGTQPFGPSDSVGIFRLEGVMAAEHRGQWVEQWTMGGRLLSPILSFAVV